MTEPRRRGDDEPVGGDAASETEDREAADEERAAVADPASSDGDGWPELEQHAPGGLSVPDDVSLLQGEPLGGKRPVGIVVSRFNGEITSRLLERALDELDRAGVPSSLVTVMPVPGAFELPLAAMALAKTRRFACVVALGCVIRGETPHFDFVAGEAASGLQLAALETGVPVAFGVLTVESQEQAEARLDRAGEAVRTGLEMADLFSQLRASTASG